MVQNTKNDIIKAQKGEKIEPSQLEENIRSMDDATLKQYIEIVKRDIARQELITKSKDLKPGDKITKDTFATAEEKAKALSEIKRHQTKLDLARKIQIERKSPTTKEEEKPQEPEPQKPQETQKITPEVSQEMAYSIRDFTK